MRKNIKIIGFAITALSLMMIVIKVSNNKEDDMKNIPKLQIESNSVNANSFISNYNYDGAKKYLLDYDDDKYSLTIAPSSEINLKFSNVPHEYIISQIDSNKNTQLNDYSFEAPSSKGAYTYYVTARWYDKGHVTYKFTVYIK